MVFFYQYQQINYVIQFKLNQIKKQTKMSSFIKDFIADSVKQKSVIPRFNNEDLNYYFNQTKLLLSPHAETAVIDILYVLKAVLIPPLYSPSVPLTYTKLATAVLDFIWDTLLVGMIKVKTVFFVLNFPGKHTASRYTYSHVMGLLGDDIVGINVFEPDASRIDLSFSDHYISYCLVASLMTNIKQNDNANYLDKFMVCTFKLRTMRLSQENIFQIHESHNAWRCVKQGTSSLLTSFYFNCYPSLSLSNQFNKITSHLNESAFGFVFVYSPCSDYLISTMIAQEKLKEDINLVIINENYIVNMSEILQSNTRTQPSDTAISVENVAGIIENRNEWYFFSPDYATTPAISTNWTMFRLSVLFYPLLKRYCKIPADLFTDTVGNVFISVLEYLTIRVVDDAKATGPPLNMTNEKTEFPANTTQVKLKIFSKSKESNSMYDLCQAYIKDPVDSKKYLPIDSFDFAIRLTDSRFFDGMLSHSFHACLFGMPRIKNDLDIIVGKDIPNSVFIPHCSIFRDPMDGAFLGVLNWKKYQYSNRPNGAKLSSKIHVKSVSPKSPIISSFNYYDTVVCAFCASVIGPSTLAHFKQIIHSRLSAICQAAYLLPIVDTIKVRVSAQTDNMRAIRTATVFVVFDNWPDDAVNTYLDSMIMRSRIKNFELKNNALLIEKNVSVVFLNAVKTED